MTEVVQQLLSIPESEKVGILSGSFALVNYIPYIRVYMWTDVAMNQHQRNRRHLLFIVLRNAIAPQVLVFSQWEGLFDVLAQALSTNGVSFARTSTAKASGKMIGPFSPLYRVSRFVCFLLPFRPFSVFSLCNLDLCSSSLCLMSVVLPSVGYTGFSTIYHGPFPPTMSLPKLTPLS